MLPKKLHWLVYEELHGKMGHLEADRVLETGPSSVLLATHAESRGILYSSSMPLPEAKSSQLS